MAKRMDSLQKSGLIGCLNDTGITSQNYKDALREKALTKKKSMMSILRQRQGELSKRRNDILQMGYIRQWMNREEFHDIEDTLDKLGVFITTLLSADVEDIDMEDNF